MSDYVIGDLLLRVCPIHAAYSGNDCQIITFQSRKDYRAHLKEHWAKGEGRKGKR